MKYDVTCCYMKTETNASFSLKFLTTQFTTFASFIYIPVETSHWSLLMILNYAFRIARKGLSRKKTFFQELFSSPHLFHFMKFPISFASLDKLLMAITEVRVITSV